MILGSIFSETSFPNDRIVQSLYKNSNLQKCTQKKLQMLQGWETTTQSRTFKNYGILILMSEPQGNFRQQPWAANGKPGLGISN